MTLSKDDVAFLEGLGLPWRVEPDPGDQSGYLIVEGFDVSGGGFEPGTTTLMIQIPPLYNTSPLDMWYCDPPLRRAGQYPLQAEIMMAIAGRTWQRFSRHLGPGEWRPGRDGLRTFFTFIFKELQGRAG